MRPPILFPLFANVSALPGIGPRNAKLFEKLAGPHVVDLLWHLPTGLIDRRFAPKVMEAPEGAVCTLTLRIHKHEPPGTPRRPYKITASDDSGFISLVFFHAHTDWLRRALPEGETRVVSGRIERFAGRPQMTHPDHIGTLEELATLQAVEPVYPMTAGVTPKLLRKAVHAALERTPELPEWQDAALLQRRSWPPFRAALQAAHAPESDADLLPTAPARQRLAYDELLSNQLALMVIRARQRKQAGRSLKGEGRLRQALLRALPFRLTGAQNRSIAEIEAEMASPTRMLRLLQGDVGSGKTVVALFAMLNAIECGAQAALMAPTEILARQHHATIAPLAERIGLSVTLLTGREKGRARDAVLAGLADGSTQAIVGTHALFQEDVAFKDLGLAVIDEQHRFGVHQRLALAGKGQGTDVLVMTATPIPRTLALTVYGDMESSRLDEKPPGRKPIATRIVPLERLDEVIDAVTRALAAGAKIYWVCPLVEESEVSDLAAATERHALLAERFGTRVGLVHGKMKGADKDAVMQRFAQGDVDLLVATTVIEVGVDVPAATVMVIEHAERFGLAQMHQLRGRIGRGDKPASCLLLYAKPLGETAKARLAIMRETEDGFRIAEEDLRLRGAGELLGTRQSGLPEFRLADVAVHGDLLAVARDDARLVMERDAALGSPRGQALRVLLYLFERDAAIRLLQSG
ncbi:MAG: ATP-dependent DNA helicase RecG [Alphaproteobacteria bacterium]|nr:ATP-dependent DNA helicase RecG [Alphaproteobacteria bacterium]